MAAKKTGLAGTPLVRAASRSRSMVSALQDVSGGEGLLSVRVDVLIDNPSNPVRRSVESEATQQLARSIQQVGVIQPLIVVAAADFAGEFPQHAAAVGGEGWVILAGHERRAAARIAGLEVVPAVVRSAERAGEVLLHENLHRDELTPIEEAQAFSREMEQQGLTQRQMGEHAGVSQGHINKRLQLLKLPEGLQARVASGELAAAPAVELVKDNDADVLAHLADTFDDNAWHLDSKVRESRNAVLLAKRVTAGWERAQQEGVPFLEDPMTTFEHTEWQHELRASKDIEAARAASDLAYGPARGNGNDVEPVAYRMSGEVKKERSLSRFEAASKQAEKDRKAGMKARRVFLRELARTRPSKPDQLRLAVATTVAGLSLGSQVTHLARVIAQGAGLGPSDTTEDWTWRTSLATVEAEATREHLAWVINLAALEDHAAANNRANWPQAVVGYLRFLTERGYEPLPWEIAALDAAEAATDADDTGDDSTGITEVDTDDSSGITQGQEGQS